MNEQNRGRLFFNSLGPVLIAIFLQNAISFFVIQLIIVLRAATFRGGDYSDLLDELSGSIVGSGTLAWVSLAYSVTGLVVFGIWFYRQKGGASSTHLSLKGYSPLLIGGMLLFATGAQFFSNYLVKMISKLFPVWLTEYTELMERAGLTNIGPVMILYAMIFGPIVEELIFRGLTYSKLRRAFGFWTANILQALLFAGYHMNKMQAAYAFIMGLALGYVVEKTGNLYVTILLHIAYNSLAFVSSYLMDMVPDMPVITFAMILGSLLLAYAGIMLTLDSAPDTDEAQPQNSD